MKDAPFCVGFAAESEDLAKNAHGEAREEEGARSSPPTSRRRRSARDENAIRLYDARGEHDLGAGRSSSSRASSSAHVARHAADARK